MQADGVAGRDNSTRDDVIAIKQRASNGLTDAVDINRGSGDESDDETGGSGKQTGDHQDTEPTDIDAVVGVSNPLAKILPAA